MGKRDPVPEVEVESIEDSARERMLRFTRMTCVFKVLERAGIEPVSTGPYGTAEDAEALEAQVVGAGLLDELEASVENREWVYRG